jgi:ribonuclease HI
MVFTYLHDNAKAGSGGYVKENCNLNFAVQVPLRYTQSNQTGKMYAILHISKMVNKGVDLFIETDSMYVISSLTERLFTNEDQGYTRVSNRALIQETANALRSRLGATSFKWVKGHAGHIKNKNADKLAAEGAALTATDTLESKTAQWDASINLSTLTQKLAYATSRERKMDTYQERSQTEELMNQTTNAFEDVFGREISNT